MHPDQVRQLEKQIDTAIAEVLEKHFPGRPAPHGQGGGDGAGGRRGEAGTRGGRGRGPLTENPVASRSSVQGQAYRPGGDEALPPDTVASGRQR
jgi:hypothetical protein